MLKRMLIVLALVLASGFTLVACGGGETTDGGDTAENGAADDGMADDGMGTALTVVTLDSFAFDPVDVSAAAGTEVNLTLDNTGQGLEHSWVLVPMEMTQEEAVALADPPPAEQILYEQRVQADETSSGTFTAPAVPGTYIVVCAVPGHAAGGMLGSLTVE